MNTFGSSTRPKDKFFEALWPLTLTYEEVLLDTGFSAVEPSKTNIESRFSRNVPLKAPFVSAAMDTVTEGAMAVALARCGGLGIIHRGMDPEHQAKEVATVKHYLHGLISKPVSVSPDMSISEFLLWKEEKGYRFDTFLVVEKKSGILVGVLTKTDVRFCRDTSAKVKAVMTPREDLITAGPRTGLKGAHDMLMNSKKGILPLVRKNGTPAGLYVFSDVDRIVRGGSPLYNTDGEGRLRVGAAIGTGAAEIERALLLAEKDVDALVIDTAHGDTKNMLETIRELKINVRNVDLVVGNVSNGASAMRLAEVGVDGIKVGQGPGSICTTRSVTGTGRPQLSAVADCENAVRSMDIPVCADGGISSSGHVAFALAAGASSVMLGRMLAGTDEAPGDVVIRDGQRMKRYRGMGSARAMEDMRSSRERYRRGEDGGKRAPEGVEALVPYQGAVSTVVGQFAEYLRSSLGYVGAETISELTEKAHFVRISAGGIRESGVHDVQELPEVSEKRGL